jgi:hypothetical protein
MLVYLNNCEKCLDHLHEKCAWSVPFYLSICKTIARGDKVYFRKRKYPPYLETMKLLEREGFILTTEDGLNEIRVIVLGHNIDVDEEDERHYFCAFQDKHI